MDENQSLQVAPQMSQQLTVADAKSQADFIHQILTEVMTENEHYGLIPGCGDKKALFKAGAEKLNLVFRMAPRYTTTITELGNGHREYSIKCELIHIPTGKFLGEGLGSCSTMESKYRYRGNETVTTGVVVPKDYWDLKRAQKFKEARERLGGERYVAQKIDGAWFICEKGEKKDNPDIADTYNTCLKMAKKRAHVDAVLTATAASDIFTQDIEETVEVTAKPAPEPNATAAKAPTSDVHEAEIVNDAIEPHDAQTEAKEAAERFFGNEEPKEPAHFPKEPMTREKKPGTISEPQRKRFYAIYKKAGKTEAEVKAHLLKAIGSEHSADIPWKQYEAICQWADPTLVSQQR